MRESFNPSLSGYCSTFALVEYAVGGGNDRGGGGHGGGVCWAISPVCSACSPRGRKADGAVSK